MVLKRKSSSAKMGIFKKKSFAFPLKILFKLFYSLFFCCYLVQDSRAEDKLYLSQTFLVIQMINKSIHLRNLLDDIYLCYIVVLLVFTTFLPADLPEAEKLALSLCFHNDRPSIWKTIYFECLSRGKHFLEQVLVSAPGGMETC